MKGFYGDRQDRFASLEKRNFRTALVRLLETEYKIVGSRRVLEALADDVEQLQREYFPLRKTGIGDDSVGYDQKDSLTTMRKLVAEYEAKYPDDPLPLKGYILDQGSRPTHKALILNLYEQGIDPTDIAQRTNHGLDAVDRYIKAYERVKGLYKKGLQGAEIQKVTGLSLKVVNAYLTIAKHFHPKKKGENIPLGTKKIK